MHRIFKKVPLRENYKETVDDYVRLKAPPNISRACFVFELFVAAAAFSISFYISFTSTTSVTSITYESLDSPYECKILSPRSDLLSFSAKSSEVVAFSSSRYGYDECISELGKDGMDACADANRQDFVISLLGLKSSDDECLDLVLDNGYRFCQNQGMVGYQNIMEAFPTSPDAPSTALSGYMYYFANSSDTVRVFTATIETLQSGWVSYGDSVFVVAESSADHKNYVYEFAIAAGSTSTSSVAIAAQLVQVDLGSATLIGFSVANDIVYVWSAKSTTEGSIFSYNLNSKVTATNAVDCTSISDDEYSTPTSGSASRMFHAANDGYLYAMCGTSTWRNAFTFYQIDATTMAKTQLHVDVEAISLQGVPSANATVTTIKSIYAASGYAYLSSESPRTISLKLTCPRSPLRSPLLNPVWCPQRVRPSSPLLHPLSHCLRLHRCAGASVLGGLGGPGGY